jgi:hypothetical protein
VEVLSLERGREKGRERGRDVYIMEEDATRRKGKGKGECTWAMLWVESS